MPTHAEPPRIAVINPNSNPVYTEHISRSVEADRSGGVTIDCLTLAAGPLAIETEEDVISVVDPICELVIQLDESVAGYMIACFADPGLQEARQVTQRPVVGCCEAAVKVATAHGSRLGLISTGDDLDADRDLILFYEKDIESLAIASPGIPTAEIPTNPSAVQKMTECAAKLEAQEVDSIIFGCAGMASYADQIRARVDVPVVEPVSAGVKRLLQILRNKESVGDAADQSAAIAR